MDEDLPKPTTKRALGPGTPAGGLLGVRVLVTRAAHQSSQLSQLLTSRGARAVEIPTIQIVDADNMAAVRDAASWQSPFDVVLFTSANGVRRFHAAAPDGGAAMGRSSALVVAIGSATEDAARSVGFRNVIAPAEHRGEAIYALLRARFGDALRTQRILLARAQLARDVLPDLLRSHGVALSVVAVYKTTPLSAEARDALVRTIEEHQVDVVTLTSSSTAENVVRALGTGAAEQLGNLYVASIGPITSQTARNLGIRVDVEASPYTTTGLVDALEKYWQARSAKP